MATEGLKMDQEAFQEHLEQSVVWEELKQELSLTDNMQGTEEIAEALFLQVRAYHEIRIVWYHILFIAVVSILAFQIPEKMCIRDRSAGVHRQRQFGHLFFGYFFADPIL